MPSVENVGYDQYDPMARLFFQYLVVSIDENMPKSRKMAKGESKFCQILNKPSKMAKVFLNFPQNEGNFGKSGHTGYDDARSNGNLIFCRETQKRNKKGRRFKLRLFNFSSSHR